MSDVLKKQIQETPAASQSPEAMAELPNKVEAVANASARFPISERVTLASNLSLPNEPRAVFHGHGYHQGSARFPGHAPQLGGEAVHFAPVSGHANIHSQVSQGIYSPVTFPDNHFGQGSAFTPNPNHFSTSRQSGNLFAPSAFDKKVGDFIKTLFKLLLAPFLPKSRKEPAFVKHARKRK